MARREGRGPRREERPSPKGGGLFTGLVIGLTVGLVTAAGVAWYINMSDWGKPGQREEAGSQPAALAPIEPAPAPRLQAQPPASPAPVAARPQPAPVRKPPPPHPVAAKSTEKTSQKPPAPPAKEPVKYTFYGILPGDKPAQPVAPPPPKDVWWLQIAALSDVAKAEHIRVQLTRLKLAARVQKIDSKGQLLYRIRVGPYTREDDAFGDLDVLTENNFFARLIKEPVDPK
ncbi:MAG: SPOR domain-containing protein [Pseudomonadota bacterium]